MTIEFREKSGVKALWYDGWLPSAADEAGQPRQPISKGTSASDITQSNNVIDSILETAARALDRHLKEIGPSKQCYQIAIFGPKLPEFSDTRTYTQRRHTSFDPLRHFWQDDPLLQFTGGPYPALRLVPDNEGMSSDRHAQFVAFYPASDADWSRDSLTKLTYQRECPLIDALHNIGFIETMNYEYQNVGAMERDRNALLYDLASDYAMGSSILSRLAEAGFVVRGLRGSFEFSGQRRA